MALYLYWIGPVAKISMRAWNPKLLLTILSISYLLRRHLSLVMLSLFSRLELLSEADTYKIPFASMYQSARILLSSHVHLHEPGSRLLGGGGSLLLRRNGRVTLDRSGHNSTSGLNTKRQRGNIKKQKILNHSLSFLFAEVSFVVSDDDLVLTSNAPVRSRYVPDSVRVKSDFYLQDSSWREWNAGQFEYSKNIVVLGHCTFAFIHRWTYG